MPEPQSPDAETRGHLLRTLGALVARGGAAPLLRAPVAPGDADFPDPWAPTRAGVALVLRRLAWHAGLDREIEVIDHRAGAPPTERKPATRVHLLEVRRRVAVFSLDHLGDDEVVGTLAHEVGVAYAALHPADGSDPYRTAELESVTVDADTDLARGSIAAVYLGLGVLAANAARQHHAVLERQGYNPLIVASVGVTVEAGPLPAESLTYLVAVQAAVRGDREPPPGLAPAQRRDVEAWLAVLDGADLRAQLGVPANAAPSARPAAAPFADAALEPDAAPTKIAFRWRTHRGGVGLVAGTVLGLGLTLTSARAMMPWLALGAAGAGHVIGRRVRVPRCSSCATVLPEGAARCPACGAVLKGDIARLSDRLDAEERLADHAERS